MIILHVIIFIVPLRYTFQYNPLHRASMIVPNDAKILIEIVKIPSNQNLICLPRL